MVSEEYKEAIVAEIEMLFQNLAGKIGKKHENPQSWYPAWTKT
jgi:hypothetical protein